MNKLYYGDCLQVMRDYMTKDSVDLIYLDPPFNSNRAYNAIYKDETGRPLPDQIEAFCDLWTLDEERERAIRALPKIMQQEGMDASVVRFWKTWMDALRYTNPKLLAYLSYMTERLLQMKIVLRPTGSIYLHCDPTASHYIKVIMDGVFGHQNFQNEIVWCYGGRGMSKKRFNRKHDIILFYSKKKQHMSFYPDNASRPVDPKYAKRYNKIDEQGRKYARIKNRDGTYSNIYLSDVVFEDWWRIPYARGEEYMGYPTQKPLKLLKRIIKASSNKDDVVLDPFCGCGTTLDAAQELQRNWIGIDIAIHAIKRVSAVRLKEKWGLQQGEHYELTGAPRSLEGAAELWQRDKYQFQKWAVEMVDGFVTAKKTGDGGVDGRLYFDIDDQLKAMKLEVKGGSTVRINDLRALAGIIDEQDYPMGGFITRKTLGKVQRQNFEDFCRTKGTKEIKGNSYPRLQFLSVAEILEGKTFDTPLVRGKSSTLQMSLFGENQNPTRQ